MESCNCRKEKEIICYKYELQEEHMGFVDYDNYVFEPNYCPFCGKKHTEESND